MAPMNIENPGLCDIFCLGDSITYGEWDAAGGWVQRLRQAADAAYIAGAGPKTHVYNLGISGHTSAQLLARAPSELAARVNAAAQTHILIAIGMNDAHVVLPGEGVCAAPEHFAENLRALVALARHYTKDIALLGLNPIDDRRTDPLPWNRAKAYRLPRVALFNDVIAEITKTEAVDFIDVWQDWQGQDIAALVCDGLHPNAAGHARIAARVGEYLKLPLNSPSHLTTK